MKENTSPKKYKTTKPKFSVAKEAAAEYRTIKQLPIVADFTYKKFHKIAHQIPFTLQEWANILHLSERTLQRYAKDNIAFEGIYVDKILHIQELLQLGLAIFDSGEILYKWLKKEKNIFNHKLNFESLFSTRGIQETIDELGRIQHGIYI